MLNQASVGGKEDRSFVLSLLCKLPLQGKKKYLCLLSELRPVIKEGEDFFTVILLKELQSSSRRWHAFAYCNTHINNIKEHLLLKGILLRMNFWYKTQIPTNLLVSFILLRQPWIEALGLLKLYSISLMPATTKTFLLKSLEKDLEFQVFF